MYHVHGMLPLVGISWNEVDEAQHILSLILSAKSLQHGPLQELGVYQQKVRPCLHGPL